MKKLTLSSLTKASIFIGVSSFAGQSFAQDTQLNEVIDAGKEINLSANQSQQRVDQISDQIQTKLQKFKAVNKEIDGLDVYNQQMQTQLDNQIKEISQLAVSMEQVSIIERQISPLMSRMINTLELFIALDVPFLSEERQFRLTDLKAMLERADIAVSEKFRRVLEAYQIEVDYGRTIEAYTGLIDIDGSERDVDFLRIGRVSFVYQTRDGERLGVWQQTTKSWQLLPAQYRADINKGLRIARKQLAPDLIIVPIAQNSAE